MNISFSEMQANFKKLIPDYGEVLTPGRGSLAVALCSKVLYKQGPTKKMLKARDSMSVTLNDPTLRAQNNDVNPILNI